jgi:hypothetical protein
MQRRLVKNDDQAEEAAEVVDERCRIGWQKCLLRVDVEGYSDDIARVKI